jgi:hypothetical protein
VEQQNNNKAGALDYVYHVQNLIRAGFSSDSGVHDAFFNCA